MTFHQILSYLGLFALLTASAGAPAQEPSLVVENARVIAGEGTVLDRGTVVVADERILAVTNRTVDAPDARWIDAAGRTVLPGLVDAHVHLLVGDMTSLPRSDEDLDAYVGEGLPTRLRAYLEAGITTVVSTGDFWPAIRRVRENIRSGETPGPRVFTSGPVFTAPGGHPAVTVCGRPDSEEANPWCREHMAVEVASRRDARTAVERLAPAGLDFVKMVYDSISPPDVEQLETDVLREIVAASHDNDLKAYAHINGMGDARTAVEAGLDGLVHVPFRTSMEGQLGRLVEAMDARGVTAVTTSVVLESLRDRFADDGRDELAEWFSGNLDGRLQTIRRIAEADEGLVVLGTDAPRLPPAEAFHREVRLLAEAGLTPARIIRTATRNAAAHLGRDDELGTLEPGKVADLIVVDGDPLEDLSALRNVELVVKGGEVVIEAGTEP